MTRTSVRLLFGISDSESWRLMGLVRRYHLDCHCIHEHSSVPVLVVATINVLLRGCRWLAFHERPAAS
jgi:hypothetical protein